jgi:DNA polymerase III subunit epsilon
MLIRDAIFTAIDFESAGTSRGNTDAPIQIGLASWSVALEHHHPFTSYLHTSQPIHWSAQKVHGITPGHLTEAPTLLSLWPDLKSRLAGAVVVAHSKGTEKRFLRTFPGHGFGPWIDTLHLARAAWPELAGHSLGALCDSLELTETIRAIVPGKAWHDALFDSVASLAVLARIVALHDLSDQPVDVLLHPDTSRWHRSRRS